MMNFEEWCEKQRQFTEKMVTQLNPNDDLMPQLALMDSQGLTTLVAMPNFTESKDFHTNVVIPKMVKETKAIYGAMVVTAWKSVIPSDKPPVVPLIIPPRMDPDRSECIILTCFNNKLNKIFCGNLTRRKEAHPLMEWEKEWESSTGRFSNMSSLIKN